jgi:hypothetical protein
MHFQCMPYTTLTVRADVAKRLRGAKGPGESYSEILERLLDNQPAKTVQEWLVSLAPLEGHPIFSAAERTALKQSQSYPRDSRARKKRNAAA